jgi:hypothetical protein
MADEHDADTSRVLLDADRLLGFRNLAKVAAGDGATAIADLSRLLSKNGGETPPPDGAPVRNGKVDWPAAQQDRRTAAPARGFPQAVGRAR